MTGIHLFYNEMGVEKHDIICTHMILVATIAAEQDFSIWPDLGINDTWYCNKCGKKVNMSYLIEIVKNGFEGKGGIRVRMEPIENPIGC